MEEGKRFIRYSIPGLATVPQLLLFIYFYNPCFFSVFLDPKQDNLGLVVTTIFTSGIIGYIFSSVYYVIHWYLAFKLTKLNYIKIVNDPENAILFKDYKTIDLSQNEAGATMSVCWKMQCDNKYSELSSVEKTFGNILHSIGTTIMIMITGMMFELYFLILKFGIREWNTGKFLIINLIILIFLLLNYRLVANMLQTLWDQSFTKIRKDLRRKLES